ncbi:MAG TPA: ABC transporter ATP-binding protein [Streptosporangiaceae bacterium]
MNPTIKTRGLSKRYRKVTALSDCTIDVPEGSISALIGPNGAGKTTLLRLLADLASPTAGEIEVLGGPPRQDPAFLAEIGYLGQEIPLYRRFSIEDHVRAGRHLNPRWDEASIRERLARLELRFDQQVGTLSGGQRAQVALALTLAKSPKLLLLDEPLAALDPLARRQFLASLTEAVADGGLTIVLSSHLVTDIERVCDHIILLSAAKVQLCGDIEELLAEHRVLVGPRRDTSAIERAHTVVRAEHAERQSRLLVRLNSPLTDPGWETDSPNLEELVLAYMDKPASTEPTRLTAIGEDR